MTHIIYTRQPKYPDGKMSADDNGELEIAVSEHETCIKIAFGKDVSWIALVPEQAREIGTRLLAFANKDEQTYEG